MQICAVFRTQNIITVIPKLKWVTINF
uniref:Uncharacterized protein n=1 Tax=Rhizophora mucronata TaxID=61149 RepID=A0A2P2NM40_RHIMU